MSQPLTPPNPLELDALGWTDALATLFQPYGAQGLVPGRVCLEHNHVYRVLGAHHEWLAEAAGRIKYEASGRHELPAVGDWVAIRPDESGGRAMIRGILPRRTWFSRKAAGRETQEQVVAANIDTVFVVFGLDHPVNQRAIERYLVVGRRSGAEPVVVLNKSELSQDLAADIAEAVAVAGEARVHAVSAATADGVSVLRSYLQPGRTLALIGPSGAGKSSIVNRLLGNELLPTGEVRAWDQRGRHTSVHRQLVVRAEGGLIVDTPGMRELQLWDADETVEASFADVTALADGCRFRDCLHDHEPGCAVKAAVASGAMDAERYAGYLKLQKEQAAVGRLRDVRAQLDAKRDAKAGSKAMKAIEKERDRS